MSDPQDPVLIDIPERLDGPRTVLLAPHAGLGAELAVVITQAISHLRPWMPWAQEAPTAESSELVVRRMQADFIARRDLCFQIYARRPDGSPGRMLGGTGLHRIDWVVRRFEIGYWIRPEAAGQGHVSEAVALLTALAFDRLGARRVEIRCDARNLKSRAVAQRCGFELEGVLRNEALGVDGAPRDTAVYSRITG
ncbi:GNAT family protein [Roseateles sp.]|uniref:GNAT family N-acetyltransferase n=1 Tax=Roseateles sp. TaxID=1971397 RepID=UPI0032651548